MKLQTNFESIDEFLFQWSPKIFYTKYIILNIHTDWDPEAREYNLLLLGTLGGFVKLWMAENTFKTSLFFIWDCCSSRCPPSLGTSGSSKKAQISNVWL